MSQFTPEQSELIADFKAVLPLFATPGRFAVTLGGSHAKGCADHRSDFDFRLYCDELATDNWPQSPGWMPYHDLKAQWTARGFRIDDFWPRTVSDVESQLIDWEGGKLMPTPVVWSVWGYHILTDIAAQQIISDPDDLVAGWKTRLSVYSPALKNSILKQHGEFVRYWKTDYHYQSKAERGDAIFLSGLSAKIVHSLSQILFALNEVYFPGDGWNAPRIEKFACAPRDFSVHATAALYPKHGPQMFEQQRAALVQLIEEVESLLPAHPGNF